MLVPRLGFAVTNLCKINRPTCLLFQRSIKKESTDEDETPIPYSESKAPNWKASYSRIPPNNRVWYTPYVVTASVSIFMLYFCILREENDLDEIIYRPLPETLIGIEKVFPHIDFYSKPNYVKYYEEQRKLKEQSTEAPKQVK